jgi:hypothetical protein
MPFVLMPNLWKKISYLSYKPAIKGERAHGDGMLVDYDSPEALEEVFWRIFTGQEYIRENKLIAMTAGDEIVDKFRLYIAAIVAKQNKCYLSKNNNNILRLSLIRKAFPKAVIVVPFRDPLAQADSLLRMHQRFTAEQKKDKFFLKYMTWLSHHEFGYDHRPFCFTEHSLEYSDTTKLDYWLEIWLSTYSWLYKNAQQEVIFISYETLCEDLDKAWAKLARLAGISQEVKEADQISLRTHQIDSSSVNQDLLAKASRLYVSLKAQELVNI